MGLRTSDMREICERTFSVLSTQRQLLFTGESQKPLSDLRRGLTAFGNVAAVCQDLVGVYAFSEFLLRPVPLA